MAHGLNTVLRRSTAVGCKSEGKGGIGSRRIFAPHFKLQVLDSYRNDTDCKGNQRATARKYGIHRRQIQKWLQCENNLRNSVGKVKAVSLEARKCGPEVSLRSGQHRQQDDFCTDAYSQSLPERSVISRDNIQSSGKHDSLCFQEDRRVPVITNNERTFAAPLDYTMHSRSRSTSPYETGAPMDLSFKRPASNTPVYSNVNAHVSIPPSAHSPSGLVQHMDTQTDIWDLSIKHQKTHRDIDSPPRQSQSKPVKLFKPYLDDLNEELIENKPGSADGITPCCNNGSVVLQPENEQFYNNNYIGSDYTYSLHELQPKNTINYYYTVNRNYICSPQCEKVPLCSTYDHGSYIQPLSPPIKGRQCYSLDFKVSAIEYYYQDSIRHGSEHGVPSKFNIERDQFPKWLKQEDELHINNENKFMHVVR